MSSSPPSLFDAVPHEVLEHIAFYAATTTVPGPPADLIPLLLVSRKFAAGLSQSANPHLYARIFAAKFDIGALVRRLGPSGTTAPKLAVSLRRRFAVLRRLRARMDCFLRDRHPTEEDGRLLHEMLWTAYVMMLENDGLNERQLREYAQMDIWLRDFWFDPNGASCATVALRDNMWPPNTDVAALTMWLFWFLLRPEDYSVLDDATFRTVVSILKLLALGAHQYPVCQPSWAEFQPDVCLRQANIPSSYGDYPPLTPSPLAAPAILSYLSLAPKASSASDAFIHASPLNPSSVSTYRPMSSEWDSEWKRDLCLAAGGVRRAEPPGAFRPGSMEGVWEGLFTYMEFTAYAALLSGAPPPTLHKSLVARHQQTWKLREYHLLAPESMEERHHTADRDCYRPLSAGDPLRAYLPNGIDFQAEHDGIRVFEPGRSESLFYHRTRAHSQVTPEYAARVLEILVAGEGHSAWGQFNLIGRIRPGDGFISLSKEYVDGDRGKWLYRGYLIGDVYGNLAGRWRDTLSPFAVPGYEGCFFMGRRR
ncbi:hypothetical protein DENSPDRAFT_840689 [Dentipellis sp. KUC8613]|nr:hypothetical protein DENSPDRAFT_840689 [Dentipellis sp. KUC8613]